MKKDLSLRSGVYLITNIINHKEYGGSAAIFRVRWWQHRTALKGGYHHNKHLRAAWDKYGEAAFIFEPVEIVEHKEGETDKEFDKRLTAREAAWVRVLDLKNPRKGYNKNDPETGRLGAKHTEKTKEAVRNATSKTYKVTDPEGRIVTIKNLTKFSVEKGLSIDMMHKVASGSRPHHRGWTCERTGTI